MMEQAECPSCRGTGTQLYWKAGKVQSRDCAHCWGTGHVGDDTVAREVLQDLGLRNSVQAGYSKQ